MKKINQYILEKFKISKDIKDDFIKKIIDIIEDYLISFTYLGKSDNNRDCNVKEIEENKIEIYIEKEYRPNFWEIVAKDLVNKIKSKVENISCFYQLEIEHNKIYIIIRN